MAWNPAQYERFHDERNQPFFDLLGLVRPKESMNVIDLGCGTGELTRAMHEKLVARSTLGVDSSSTMLERAKAFVMPGISFRQAEVESLAWGDGYDLIFSNAALQWVPDNPAVLRHMARVLAPTGQVAIQVPANDDHPSHALAAEIAGEEPFRSALAGYQRKSFILAPERYAAMLDELGFVRQHVRLQVYPHRLPSRDDVIEWVKGTLLLAYEKRLSPEQYDRFLERFRERLFQELPDVRPFFYPFKRILAWGERAG
jgi:trans-aconitate 2-methyltransferase